MESDLAHSYEIAQSGCVCIDRNSVARIWSTGEHRIDLVDRMSTNNLAGMVPGEGRPTVLLNVHARIVDYLLVLHLGDRALMLASPGKGEDVRRWLAGYVFFRDDVTFTDASGALGQFGLYGLHAADTAAALMPGAEALPLFHSLQADDAILIRVPPLAGGAYELVAPRADMDAWVARAEAAGAAPAPTALYEILRVEAGLPGPGNEIAPEYIPLEVGLWDAVSFNSGCYLGQEIIARMESRGKLAKTLVGLRAASALAPGAQLRAADGSRGIVTSSVHSPRYGWLGLGVLKPAAAVPGAEVTVAHAGEIAPATIADLPFG